MAFNQTLVLKDVRLSYVFVDEPQLDENGKNPKYSVTVMIPKTQEGEATVKRIKAAQKKTLQENLDRFGGKKPVGLKLTLRDGDDPEVTDFEAHPEYAGFYYMAVRSKTMPGLVDGQLKPLDEGEVYSGCWANVSVSSFAYNVSGNKGISFALRNIQKLRDDTPFGGVSRAEDDFEMLERQEFEDDDLDDIL